MKQLYVLAIAALSVILSGSIARGEEPSERLDHRRAEILRDSTTQTTNPTLFGNDIRRLLVRRLADRIEKGDYEPFTTNVEFDVRPLPDGPEPAPWPPRPDLPSKSPDLDVCYQMCPLRGSFLRCYASCPSSDGDAVILPRSCDSLRNEYDTTTNLAIKLALVRQMLDQDCIQVQIVERALQTLGGQN